MKFYDIVRATLSSVVYLWPSPCTLIGLAIGLLPFIGKRCYTFRRGTICFYGPAMRSLLSRVPISGGAGAMTLGHVILAVDYPTFERTFEHEWIHVRQYVWWGPFFLPAYALCSLWQWSVGGDVYLDNAFERQARVCTGEEPAVSPGEEVADKSGRQR